MIARLGDRLYVMALGRGHRVQMVVAVAGLLSFGCGGSTLENVNSDASTGRDGALGAAGADGGGEADATVGGADGCVISVSDYNTSCATDSECVLIGVGNYCTQQACNCGVAYINKQSLGRYQADFASTPAARSTSGAMCNCPSYDLNGCCIAGRCGACPPPPRTEPDGAPTDAIAYVVPADGSTLCSKTSGPVDADAPDADSIQCVPGESCTQFNGGWACCRFAGPGNTLCHSGLQ